MNDRHFMQWNISWGTCIWCPDIPRDLPYTWKYTNSHFGLTAYLQYWFLEEFPNFADLPTTESILVSIITLINDMRRYWWLGIAILEWNYPLSQENRNYDIAEYQFGMSKLHWIGSLETMLNHVMPSQADATGSQNWMLGRKLHHSTREMALKKLCMLMHVCAWVSIYDGGRKGGGRLMTWD